MSPESLARAATAHRPLRAIPALTAIGLLTLTVPPPASAADAETTATVQSLGLEEGEEDARAASAGL